MHPDSRPRSAPRPARPRLMLGAGGCASTPRPSLTGLRQRLREDPRPGTPGTVERCPYPRQGLEIIYNTVDAACPSGTWGTPNTVKDSNGGADDPDSGKVTCAMNLVQDGAGRDPLGVVCNTTRDWADEDATNNLADCQDDDGTNNYDVMATNSMILRDQFFADADQTEQMLIWAAITSRAPASTPKTPPSTPSA